MMPKPISVTILYQSRASSLRTHPNHIKFQIHALLTRHETSSYFSGTCQRHPEKTNESLYASADGWKWSLNEGWTRPWSTVGPSTCNYLRWSEERWVKQKTLFPWTVAKRSVLGELDVASSGRARRRKLRNLRVSQLTSSHELSLICVATLKNDPSMIIPIYLINDNG